jgi:hypothetical protein
MVEVRQQAVTGVVPPETAEARIREAWPSVAAFPALASVGRALTATIVLAPLAWLLMSVAYFGKLLPLLARRYTLTNRRLMIRKGWGGAAGDEIALADIDDVRVVTDANSDFFRAGNIEIVSKDRVAMTLAGIPEPDSFRIAILNARNAWAPGRVKALPFIAASAVK